MRPRSADSPPLELDSSQVGLVRMISDERADIICHLHAELDVMRARHLVSVLLERESIDAPDQTRVLTALSEVASNALRYGERGVVCAWVTTLERPTQERAITLTIKVADEGPGIPDLDWALTDHNSSGGTLGLGLSGAKRLIDRLDIVSPIPQLGYGSIVTLEMTWR